MNIRFTGVVLAKGTGTHAPLRDGDEEANQDHEGDELAQIIHDLKTPLSSLALETELLGTLASCCDRTDVQDAVGRIRRNVRYLDRLVYDLLDVCTLTSGQFALRRSRCELGELIASVIDRVVPVADRHRVLLDAGSRTELAVDELRIERVIANLLDNALKYTPSSGGIVVRLRSDARTAQISVSDCGPGLSAGEAALVFERFRRGASSRGRPGAGLGLYVSKQIVEAHGGEIGVESVRGVGARFYFALPLT